MYSTSATEASTVLRLFLSLINNFYKVHKLPLHTLPKSFDKLLYWGPRRDAVKYWQNTQELHVLTPKQLSYQNESNWNCISSCSSKIEWWQDDSLSLYNLNKFFQADQKDRQRVLDSGNYKLIIRQTDYQLL